MKSFGLWYLLNSLEMDKHDPNESAENRESEKTVPKFELHVNFWSLEEYKHMSSKKVPCSFLIITKLKYFNRLI